MCVRDRDVHDQWYQTAFSFALSEPLTFIIHQKFKAQACVTVDYENTRTDYEKSAVVHKGLAETKVREQNDQK